MNRFTKFTLAAASVFTVCSAPVFASGGIYGTGLVLTSGTGGYTPSTTLYEALLGGGGDYGPDYSSAPGNTPATLTINTYDTSGDLAAGTVNLGTFNLATSDSLTLDGGEVLTYKNGSDNFTGANLFYTIDNGSFTTAPLAFNQDDLASSAGSDNQRWYTDTDAVNLLSGLSNGTYTLDVYYNATDNYGSGTYVPVDNNGGPNYNATFTVVPEPSTIMMLLGSSLFGSFYLLRRKRS